MPLVRRILEMTTDYLTVAKVYLIHYLAKSWKMFSSNPPPYEQNFGMYSVYGLSM